VVAVREQNMKPIKGMARGLLREEVLAVAVAVVVAVVVAEPTPAAKLMGYQRI
jgi:hypothetical protein